MEFKKKIKMAKAKGKQNTLKKTPTCHQTVQRGQ